MKNWRGEEIVREGLAAAGEALASVADGLDAARAYLRSYHLQTGRPAEWLPEPTVVFGAYHAYSCAVDNKYFHGDFDGKPWYDKPSDDWWSASWGADEVHKVVFQNTRVAEDEDKVGFLMTMAGIVTDDDAFGYGHFEAAQREDPPVQGCLPLPRYIRHVYSGAYSLEQREAHYSPLIDPKLKSQDIRALAAWYHLC